jgi:hypothetical protein
LETFGQILYCLYFVLFFFSSPAGVLSVDVTHRSSVFFSYCFCLQNWTHFQLNAFNVDCCTKSSGKEYFYGRHLSN